jgi:transcription elongation factor Elf1
MHVSKEKHLLHITRYHSKQLSSGAVSRVTPEPFLCNICGKKFVTSQSLNYHFDVHSTGRKYKCEFEGCSTAYRHPRDLNRHRRDFHTGGTFKCPHCRRYFTTVKRLEVHQNLLHKQDNWICEQCGKSFETRMRLMKHEYRHKGYNPFNCTEMLPGTDSLCNYTTATKSCFAQHLMARHGVEFNETIHTRPIPEELAKQMYQQRTAAKQENMAYRCSQPGCSKGFQTSTGLHHHL